MPFFYEDFFNATLHLSDSKALLYLKMITWQFRSKEPFKNEVHARKALGLPPYKDKIILELFSNFFIKTDKGFIQKRTFEVIDFVDSKSTIARENANKRWKKNNADALLEKKVKEINTPNPLLGGFPRKNGLNEEEKSVCDQGFKAFWDVYPLKISKAQAIEKYAKALAFTDDKTILEGAKKYAVWCEKQAEQAKKQKKPATTPLKASSWLFHKRWEDELEPSKTVPKTHLETILEAKMVKDITTGKTYKPSDAKHERRFDSDELMFPCGERVDVKFLRKVEG